MDVTEQDSAQQNLAEQGPKEQVAVQSGAVQKLAVQQEPIEGEGLLPTNQQTRSEKRGAVDDDEDESNLPAKRRKVGNGVEIGTPTENSIGFRPANRAPPTEEDLELTQPLQEDTLDAGGESDIESDPSSPQVSTTKRVSELRAGRPQRSSRTRHMEKLARRSGYRLRSSLRKEWSMS